MEIKFPQFINVDREVKAKYLEPLIKNRSSMFYGRELTDVYFLSASIGLKNNIEKETLKSENLRLYSTAQERYKLLIRIIVLSKTNFDYGVLQDGKRCLKIVEGYANGGAPILYGKIFEGKGLDFSIEDEMLESVENK